MASTITTLKHFKIPLEEVVKATNNFDDKYVIGEGGFGKVYGGQLLLSGKMVNIAARRLDRKYGQGNVEFLTEISVLSSLEHENIVSLIGFCDENGEKIIVNKREAKGSLSMYLSNPRLTWIQRLKICVGVARALRHIHNGEGRGYCIIHRNINSWTILLDDNLEARLSGFEYCLKQSVNRMDHQAVLAEAIGTTGYMDPSIEKTGGVTYKSDIYSFGVVLCETLCGRKAFIPDADDRFVAQLFRVHYKQKSLNDIIHPDLCYQMTHKSLAGFSKVADSCLKEDRAQRPNMNNIVIELEKALELEILIKKLEHLKIPLGDIMLATDNFSEAYRIGYDGFYKLYRAELEHFDRKGKNKNDLWRTCNTILIKQKLPSEDQEKEVFYTDIKMLDICKHPSIVKLLGFCDEGSDMILVVEHLSNGYLTNYWKNLNGMKHILTWAKRLKICLDVANALNYLHNEMEDQKMIIHRDIRSNCIALDENWGAKIIEFCISVLLPLNLDDEAHDIVYGTNVYMDPEYELTGLLKRESDVYSFGVVLFEVLCGRLANDPIYLKESESGLAFVARRCFRKGTLMEMIDPTLKEEIGDNNFILNRGPNKESLKKFVKIAHQCVKETQDQRPTMKWVVKELQEALLFQEGKLQPLDMADDADEVETSMGLIKLTRENSEDMTECGSSVEDVDEVKKFMELKLANANLIKILEHLKIPLDDILLATDNFSDAYKVEIGRYYMIYTAELEYFDEENDMRTTRNKVSIKRLIPDEDGEMFYTHIRMLNICKHPNIVKLLGFCDEGSEMIIVVEHLSNGDLYDYLWYNDLKHILNWAKRLKICLDVAKALNYLHNEMAGGHRVIHRDIRNNFIWLDENWGAKIVEFGFSVSLPPTLDDEALYDKIEWGTYVYMDPEYTKTGGVKTESDVYSFGVLMFEILCGRLANDSIYSEESYELGIAFVARRHFHEGTLIEMMDPLLKEESDENSFSLKRGPNKDSFEKFVKIAHECIAETQDQRPTMKVVMKELQEALFFEENEKYEIIISLEDIKLATQNFHDDNCIGRGGFGKVYKGRVSEGDGFNTIVAKRLNRSLGQGERQFRTEIQILFEYKHENIITLVGYCDEKNEQIIVYEYASRGSLNRYLKDDRLTWMKRLDICIGVATALDFIHGGAGKQAIVIHRDIKTENILLNDTWEAKLADFGLSLISPINQETDYVIDHACGTEGYLDPLYLKSGFLTKESDIYSFGVVLFEILCGRSTFEIRNHNRQFLPGFIKERFEKRKQEDLVLEAIKEQIVPKALTAFQTIAYQCLHDDREKRPTAKEVLEQLKEALEFQISGSD